MIAIITHGIEIRCGTLTWICNVVILLVVTLILVREKKRKGKKRKEKVRHV